MDAKAIAYLLADEFAWGSGDLAIAPHERLDGIMALAGVDVDALPGGSKRTRLRAAAANASPAVRLALVKAVLEELPPHDGEPADRSKARERLELWVQGEEGIALLPTGSAAVDQALAEFDHLSAKFGPNRAFDRLHSAFSAYLRDLHRLYLGPAGTKPLQKLLESVAGALPTEADPDGMAAEVLRSVKSIAGALDSLRNKPAHGELAKENADLARDVVASAFRFLLARLGPGWSDPLWNWTPGRLEAGAPA